MLSSAYITDLMVLVALVVHDEHFQVMAKPFQGGIINISLSFAFRAIIIFSFMTCKCVVNIMGLCNRARFPVQWREVSISTSRDKQRVRGPCVVLLMVQLYTERIKLQIEVYNSDVDIRLDTHFPRKTVTRDPGLSVSFLPDVPRLVTRAHCYSLCGPFSMFIKFSGPH